jgi:methylthioribulose-1-phosphate dehydratase
MSNTPDFTAQARMLVEAGREFHARGWVPATSGNFSARVNDSCVAVTVSGRDKGCLREDDIMLVDMAGQAITAGKRPSAETLLHTALYRRYPDAKVAFHTHSVAATVLSLTSDRLTLEGYELLKAFPGVDTHEARITLRVFPNDQDMQRLSGVVDAYIERHRDMPPAYMIAGHGIYTWAGNERQARIQVEALEFMFECELMRRRLAL